MSNTATPASPIRAMLDGLSASGWEKVRNDDPRAYVAQSGKRFTTFVRNAVQVALSGHRRLVRERCDTYIYDGEDTDVVIEVIAVDPGHRRQGRANAALLELVALADANGVTLYLEPVALENGSMSRAQLVAFYSLAGFAPQDDCTDGVMIRPPAALAERDPPLPALPETQHAS